MALPAAAPRRMLIRLGGAVIDGYTDGWRAAAKAADVTFEVPGGGPMFFRRVPAGEFAEFRGF